MGEAPHRFGTRAVPHILIVSADPGVRGPLATHLQESEFRVTVVADAVVMEEFINTGSVDLLVLDMMLPNHDGLSLCRRLRSGGSGLPLILFSARNCEQDKVRGLDAGADDYLTERCGGRELVARIRALLRRCDSAPRLASASEHSPLTHGLRRQSSV